MEIRPISLSTGCSGEGVGTPVVIVTAANACFARSMCVAVHSALKHVPAERDVILYVLDDGIRPEDRARTLRVLHAARSNLTIEWIDPDLSLIEGLKKPEWHTRTTYLRFLIEYIVPAEHERVLYLDSDVVVQDDITKLWEFEMGDHHSGPWSTTTPRCFPTTFKRSAGASIRLPRRRSTATRASCS